MGTPPTMLRGRMLVTTYLYEDEAHPNRITRTIASPQWTDADRALFLGLQAYEDTLCGGCGQPKDLAWHGHTEDSWLVEEFVCHACTAKTGTGEDRREIVYIRRLDLELTDFERARMGDFDWTKATRPTRKTPGNSREA